MLVLSDCSSNISFKVDRSSSKAIIDYINVYYPNIANTLKLTIRDTDTGVLYKDYDIFSLIHMLETKNILGVIRRKKELTLIKVDYLAYRLLDFVDSIKYSGVGSPLSILSKYYKDISVVNQNSDYTVFNCDGISVCIFKLFFSLKMIDDLGIFYSVDGGLNTASYCTFSVFYKLIWNIGIFDAFFVFDNSNKAFKIEINDDVKHFMTKAKVLWYNLCWS